MPCNTPYSSRYVSVAGPVFFVPTWALSTDRRSSQPMAEDGAICRCARKYTRPIKVDDDADDEDNKKRKKNAFSSKVSETVPCILAVWFHVFSVTPWL